MKSFIIKFVCFFGIPLAILLGIYLISDPFKTIKKFSLKKFSTVNRDYLSTELYLKNRNTQHYNSYIFGSSRGSFINTYQWKSYLPKGSNQFLFQAWSETLTGIYQKISFIDNNNAPIKNAIILLDIPGSFNDVQEPLTALAVKHYLLSGKTKLYYQGVLFYSILKPSEIFDIVKQSFKKERCVVSFDSISNDWNNSNKDNWKDIPKQNKTLDKSLFKTRPKTEIFSTKLIKPELENILRKIKSIFDKQKTYYKIIITPDYNQLHINKEDFRLLQQIFGKENVFNYSGKNKLTEDKYNFLDINHFDNIVGWKIIEDIFNKSNTQKSLESSSN